MNDPDKKNQIELQLWMKFRVAVMAEVATSRQLRQRFDEIVKDDELSPVSEPVQFEVRIAGLEKVRKDAIEDLKSIEASIADLNKFMADNPDFVEDYDEVKKLGDTLGYERANIAGLPELAMAAAEKARKALAKARKGTTEVQVQWTKVSAEIDAAERELDVEATALTAVLRTAKAAVAAHDTAKLKSAQGSPIASGGVTLETAAQAKALMAEFYKKLHASPSAHEQAEVMKVEIAATERQIADIARKGEANQKMRKEILSLAIKADVHKAAAALGLPASAPLQKLEKALALDPAAMPRALEELTKAAGHPMKGKDAVDKLRQAKVI